MLFLWACSVMLVVARYPETPIGKLLKRFLVELPAHRLARLSPAGVAFLVLVVAVSTVAIVFGESEGALFVAQGAPETLGWFFAFDIGTYVDVIALAWLAAATIGLRVIYERARSALAWARQTAKRAVGSLAGRIAACARSPRRRPTAPRTRKSNEDGWADARFVVA